MGDYWRWFHVPVMSGLSVSLPFSWNFPHDHKVAATAVDIISKFTEGMKEKEKGKCQNICIISFDQENKSVSQHFPSSFATSILLLVSHLQNWVTWPSLATKIRRNESRIVTTGVDSGPLAHCYNGKLRKKEEGRYWATNLNSGIRFGPCRIGSLIHKHGDKGFQGEVTHGMGQHKACGKNKEIRFGWTFVIYPMGTKSLATEI